MIQNTLERLIEVGLVPTVTLDRAEDAMPVTRALAAGGIDCIEITFRTAAAAEAIRRITDEMPEVLVGAGTVLTVEQAEQAVRAGAQFVVAPGFDAAVVEWCQEHQVLAIPGVLTPTEIQMALTKNVPLLKFFPAEEMGGTRMLKVLYPPYQAARFMPTGGINASNLAAYLALPNVAACGGSWIATRNLIAEGSFAEITRLAAEGHAIVRQARAEKEADR